MEAERSRTPRGAVERIGKIHDRTRSPIEHDAPDVEQMPDRRVVDDHLMVVVHERIVEGVQVDETAEKRGGTARKGARQPTSITSDGWLDWKHRAHEAVVVYDKSVGRRLQPCDRRVGRRHAAPQMPSLRILDVTP